MTPQVLKLANQLTFDTVNSHFNRLLTAVQGQQTAVVIDLQAVTLCDSAGLALLIDMKRRCHKQQKTLHFSGVSPAVAALAQFCGVDSLLLGVTN